MRPLTADGVVRIWEAGQRLPPLDRGLAMLAAVLPEHTPESLDALLLGEQQTLLFRLRELTFGSRLDGLAECTGCAEPVEFTLDLSSLLADAAPPAGSGEVEVRANEYALRLRPLRVDDVRAAAACGDAATARRLLGERAVVGAAVDGDEVRPTALPEPVLATVADALATLDQRAEVLIHLLCPACGAPLAPVLDPGEFLWSEIRGLAARLIGEVHALATAYGWSEHEILGMSGERRAAYLALVEG